MAKKPVADLTRSSDPTNAFSVLGACRRAAQKAGWPDRQVDEVLAEMKNGNNDHLMDTAWKYFDLKYDEDEDETTEEENDAEWDEYWADTDEDDDESEAVG